MEKRALTCIVCPSGCALTVTLENGTVTAVEGNECKRGAEYGAAECVNPVRTLTTTMRVQDSILPLSVKSAQPLPKDSLFAAMQQINAVSLQKPVRAGAVVVANVAGSGVDMIATKSII